MLKRRRSKRTGSLKDRLLAFAKEVRETASRLRSGAEKEALPDKARQPDTTARLEDWVNSRELQPPV